jgi:hypothetical protein
MQISSSSLIAAQQARTQTPAQPRAEAKPAPANEFEALLFASKPPSPAPSTANVMAQPRPAAPFARPGSQVDIKI